MADTRAQLPLRIDRAILAQIDARIEMVNARKTRDKEPTISRNDWFCNMAKWTIENLPHQAVRSDLIKAWPSLPEEALGIEK